ncbi:MAG TPA: hypothetical protein VK864_12510 [Longimicrobiales bacterium]|nr:hypothetical protein [Longimicrobiales bacterium]
MLRAQAVIGISVILALGAGVAPAQAQGRGQGRSNDQKAERPSVGQQQSKPKAQAGLSRGQGAAKKSEPRRQPAGTAARSNRAAERTEPAVSAPAKAGRSSDRGNRRFKREIVANEVRPPVHRFAASNNGSDRIAAGAVARAYARGIREDALTIIGVGNRVRIANRSGVSLLELDRERIRDLGGWNVSPLDDRVEDNAPSFCRSGAGHPVWGRQWCIGKGFGLGGYRDYRWGITRSLDDISFRRRADSGVLARDVLIDVLGDIVFDRLALHAITLGIVDPLSGVWYAEPAGPRVLRIGAGDEPVAEIVDLDRDDRADLFVVALRPW